MYFLPLFQVPSILFAPCHLMALFTLGIQTGLVVDCGYTETVVLPVSLKNMIYFCSVSVVLQLVLKPCNVIDIAVE